MKLGFLLRSGLVLGGLLPGGLVSAEVMMGSSRSAAEVEKVGSEERVLDFNRGWKFLEEDEREAFVPDFDDSDWRTVRLPHDWSVEHSFDKELEGATAYLPAGMGWYRKTFVSELSDGQSCYVYFDGIYNNAEIWLNGKRLKFHPYGYSPVVLDLTRKLVDGENVLAVRVDRSRIVDSRWYTGSGIYRNVKMLVADKLHTPLWGTYVTTPEVTADKAAVKIENTVVNSYDDRRSFTVVNRVMDPSGKEVAKGSIEGEVEAGEGFVGESVVDVSDPMRWGIEQGNLYTLETSIEVGGEVVDRSETRFGIRTFRFDADEGFFLNGENLKIKGVCLHHDAGLVGAAVPKGVWRRRLEELRAAGTNAVRISHQPGARDFMELCDEMGFLVQTEFFDEWDNPKDKRTNTWEKMIDYASRGYTEYFQEHAESDLKVTALRDRNHPSVIQWSIGNEIEWTYPRYKAATGFFDASWEGNYFWSVPPFTDEEIRERYAASEEGEYVLAETAAKLAEWTKEMDDTRPVVANMILPSASMATGYGDAVDVAGFSYRRVMYDRAHEDHPDKPIMGTENLVQWHEWKAIEERPFISGTFLWTGIDYLGEVNKQWPKKALASGMLDSGGFRKPSWHMMRTLWNEEPHVYICSQTAEKSIFEMKDGKLVEKKPGAWKQRLWIWHEVNEHWNYGDGEAVVVEVYTNCPEVELFLNGASLGKKELADFEDRQMRWLVPFAGGELKAVGMVGGKTVEWAVKTHSDPVAVRLEVDREKLLADDYDVAHVVAQLVDADGNPVRLEERELNFEVAGPVNVLGVDNGAPDNVQKYQGTTIKTSRGRAMVVLQALRKEGEVQVSCGGKGLKAGAVTVVSGR